jgi:hypothetical protein
MNETTPAYINKTRIPWNDETRDKIYEIRSWLKGIDIGDIANHKRVHAAIKAMFPQAQRRPDMYAIYVALASDLTKIKKWEEILKQFKMCGVSAEWEDEGDNERLTCICTQSELGYTVSMRNLETNQLLNVGSACMFKSCITEDQKAEGKEIEKQLNKIKREKAAERKRIKELQENFICCKKCKEYVIPRQGSPITTCFDCRIYREGYRKCPCCGYYRIKENTSYKKCFECNKLKK